MPVGLNPAFAKISAATRRVLSDLAGMPGVFVSIVSGRSLEDVRERTGLPAIYYVGNHGMLIEGPGVRHRELPKPPYKTAIALLRGRVEKLAGKFPELLIEDKPAGMTINYRSMAARRAGVFKAAVAEIAADLVKKKSIKVLPGRGVFDILPAAAWDKGKAVCWLLEHISRKADGLLLPVYVGDDVSDESAFQALKKNGVTIHVGPSKITAARWCLRSYSDVYELLKFVKAVVSGGRG